MCQVYGGHLASVSDCDVNSLLKLSIASSPRVEFWLGGKLNEGRWSWVDRSEFNYTNWAESEPSMNHERCITQDQEGKWHARDCLKRKPFICRVHTLPEALSSTLPKLASPFSIDLPKRNSCDDGWTYSDVTAKCYKLVKDVTFTQAVRTCLDLDSKLISIHNARENEWFTGEYN
ncbi:CLEC-50 protein [Aphelenchoides avenae]|nr:CLEC-50 protein [Aphelenchus avenae]